jgi:hypothetical protein
MSGVIGAEPLGIPYVSFQNFDGLLTVHLSIILVIDQLNSQILVL